MFNFKPIYAKLSRKYFSVFILSRIVCIIYHCIKLIQLVIMSYEDILVIIIILFKAG